MRYAITSEVIAALRSAIGDRRGAISAFARRTGIPQGKISNMLAGRHRVVLDDYWSRLCTAAPELEKTAKPNIEEPPSATALTQYRVRLRKAILNSKSLAPEAKIEVLKIIEEDKS